MKKHPLLSIFMAAMENFIVVLNFIIVKVNTRISSSIKMLVMCVCKMFYPTSFKVSTFPTNSLHLSELQNPFSSEDELSSLLSSLTGLTLKVVVVVVVILAAATQ
uniref:Uncharacterized protein n=1 Tax=Glossina brevipalpis TaxID=37001 RepID=A0A1A9WNB4_9MUSC